MNGIDYGNKINRQREIYQKNLIDNNRNHKEEVSNLKKTHQYREKKQVDNHSEKLGDLEQSHIKTTARIKDNQTQVLQEKNKRYEQAVNKAQGEFHEQKRDNIRTWDKKFSELRDSFSKNMKDTKSNDSKIREQLRHNYSKNVKNIRVSSNDELSEYINNNAKDKKSSDHRTRIEKNQLIAKHRSEKNKMLQDQIEKRNFLESNAVENTQVGRKLAEKRFIDGKNTQEKKFKEMNTKLNKRISSEIIDREQNTIESQVKQNRSQNVDFKKRFSELSRGYNKDVRNLEFKKRAENISRSEVNKEVQKKYRETLEEQIDVQRETQLRERHKVETSYAKRERDTVESYQDTLRERNIEAAERNHENQTNLAEINRKDKFDDKKIRDRMSNDHSVSLRYLEEKNAAREAGEKTNTNRKVRNLKENFSKSMEAARVQSKRSFELTKEAMLDDKRVLEKRLHEQNSKDNSYIKQVYNEKMEKMADGYEKRIKSLEGKNKTLIQGTNDKINNIVRKTNFEISRQNKAAKDSAKNQIKTERELSHERQNALKMKIKDLEQNFSDKINKETISNRKQMKDLKFQNTKNMASEKNRYQDVLDQNSKFMAREFERLKIAGDSERKRLITQYEDRIAKLQQVYRDKSNEADQYSKLNASS